MRILIDLFHYRQGNKLIKRSAAAENLAFLLSFRFLFSLSAFPILCRMHLTPGFCIVHWKKMEIIKLIFKEDTTQLLFNNPGKQPLSLHLVQYFYEIVQSQFADFSRSATC